MRSTETAAAYNAMAERYAEAGEGNAYNSLYERPATIALLPDVAGRRVLDVGCGSAPLSAWLVAAGAEVVGFDVSAEMVALAARRELPSASFHVGDLAVPLDVLADDSFDVVVASLVLHYVRDWVAPLRELRRVLRPHGSLVFSTHHPAVDIELSSSGNYFATELVVDEWIKGGEPFEVRFWRRPLTAMFSAIDEAGFRVDRLTEPQPIEECRERFPEDWTLLTTQPRFLFFSLSPR